MQTIVQSNYGPLTQMQQADRSPPAPGEGQVLIKVAAAGVDPSIWHLMTGTPYLARLGFGLRRPRTETPGQDAAGTVVAVGESVQDFAVGDEVFGCVHGAFAQFAIGRVEHLARIPAELPLESAAAVPTSGITALQAVRDKAQVQPGQKVAVIGAGGGVGSFAVQLAALSGAEVTGVCSTGKLDFVRGLGAARVIDYTVADLTTEAGRFDAVIDCAGNRPLRALCQVLAPRGRLVIVGGESNRAQLLGIGRPLRAAALSLVTNQQLTGMFGTTRREDLVTLAGHLAAGDLVVPLDCTFPFGDAVEAVQYVRDGIPHGKVVVAIGDD